MMKTTLFLEKCSIADTDSVVTITRCSRALYPLVELTGDRTVFSNATYTGDQTLGYVFERN